MLKSPKSLQVKQRTTYFLSPVIDSTARVSEAWLSYLYKDVFEQKSRVHLASLNLNIFTICNNGETYKTEQMHVQNILLL